jgi:hypothetical protein
MAAAGAEDALTVRVTGIVCGVLLAPVAAMVIVAEYVPAPSPEVE